MLRRQAPLVPAFLIGRVSAREGVCLYVPPRIVRCRVEALCTSYHESKPIKHQFIIFITLKTVLK